MEQAAQQIVAPQAEAARPASLVRYGLWGLGLAVLVLPLVASPYVIYLLNLTAIFALVALGLNLLTGFAGLISLGHAAFFAIGAYGTGILTNKVGLPMPISLVAGALLATAVGAVTALPALRLKSLYLAVATLGLGVVVQKIIFEWRSLTGGGGGFELKHATLGPIVLSSGLTYTYFILAVLAVATWAAGNVARSRTGRALTMLRDSEIAAGVLGIDVARYKIVAFALSAFYTATAGGLYAQLVRYINPESFSTGLSITFLSMIVIGGLGSIGGSILGAIFYVLVPELFRGFKDAPGLVFGLSLVLVMVFMPKGLWGLAQQVRLRMRPRSDAP